MLEIRTDGNGSCRFVVKSLEGHQLLESVAFATPGEMNRVIGQLKTLVQNPACLERKTDHLGRFHFTLRAPDGSPIGNSQYYRSEAGMENGIKNTLRRIAGLESE